MSKHEAVVAWLEKHVGEHEVPAGSNTGPFVQQCQAATWLPGSRWPWCVATWVKAWTVAGYKLPYLGAGAYAMADWYKQHCPAWIVPLSKAKPGAAVILNIGAGHCATLVEKYVSGGSIKTIDGNWGDKVSATTHKVSEIRCVIDPPEKQTGIIPPAKKPVFEVVTAASGHSKVVFVSGSKAIGRKLPQLLNRFGGVTIRRRKRK